ncbi:MAG TPA: redoxin domain-containing protein [Actinotalea sp.]|nr:redoxin domain-containing protein [Actinotalea sp.]
MTSGTAIRRQAERQEQLEQVGKEQQAAQRKRTLILRIASLTAVLAVIGLVVAALLSARPETSSEAVDPTPFTLPMSDGSTVSLSDYAGSPVILYFNEGAGCDSCLIQMAKIEQEPGFAEAGIEVLPIVMNTADQINADRERLGVEAPFALDDGTVSEAYGTLGTGMHEGLPGHGFILIDADGVQRWYGNYPSMWLDPAELLDIALDKL